MTTATLGRPMADEKTKTLSVKLHMDVIESARIVAAYRNESMTDMLSGLLRPQLLKMETDEVARRTKSEKAKGSTSRG